jgi:flagellar biosynthesis chaperone FliJ
MKKKREEELEVKVGEATEEARNTYENLHKTAAGIDSRQKKC